MNRLPLTLSSSSRTLLEPNLHDGKLVGIDIPSQGIVHLFVMTKEGAKYRLALDGVVQFSANGFREGNIILDLTIACGKEVHLEELDALKFEGENADHVAKYTKIIYNRVLQESLYVVELNPSYGCHVIGVAKNIYLHSC